MLHVIQITLSLCRSKETVDYVTEVSESRKTDTFLIIDGKDKVNRSMLYGFIFCGDEILLPSFVSRDDFAFVEYRSMNDINITLIVEALRTVDCSTPDMFQCSTVKCISSTQTCDGIQQCTCNRLDEYCDIRGN